MIRCHPMGIKLNTDRKGIDDPSAMTLQLLSWSEKDGYRWGMGKVWSGVGRENDDGSGLG